MLYGSITAFVIQLPNNNGFCSSIRSMSFTNSIDSIIFANFNEFRRVLQTIKSIIYFPYLVPGTKRKADRKLLFSCVAKCSPGPIENSVSCLIVYMKLPTYNCLLTKDILSGASPPSRLMRNVLNIYDQMTFLLNLGSPVLGPIFSYIMNACGT